MYKLLYVSVGCEYRNDLTYSNNIITCSSINTLVAKTDWMVCVNEAIHPKWSPVGNIKREKTIYPPPHGSFE